MVAPGAPCNYNCRQYETMSAWQARHAHTANLAVTHHFLIVGGLYSVTAPFSGAARFLYSARHFFRTQPLAEPLRRRPQGSSTCFLGFPFLLATQQLARISTQYELRKASVTARLCKASFSCLYTTTSSSACRAHSTVPADMQACHACAEVAVTNLRIKVEVARRPVVLSIRRFVLGNET